MKPTSRTRSKKGMLFKAKIDLGLFVDKKRELFHYFWTQQNQDLSVKSGLASPLLALHKTSAVNQIKLNQISDARKVLRMRRAIIDMVRTSHLSLSSTKNKELNHGRVKKTAENLGQSWQEVVRIQKRIVKRFLTGRGQYFGDEQSRPFDDVESMVLEDRDIFIVVKFMDESPHILDTMHSLLNQKNIDMGRMVIVAVDNNSMDGSDQIVKGIILKNHTKARIIYVNQSTPGGGNAARYGVDRVMATIYKMCQCDGNWNRLQRSLIAVSDGDTVYHPNLIAENVRILTQCPTVDGVMPFKLYKFTAALRLFKNHTPIIVDNLEKHISKQNIVQVPVDLSDLNAFRLLPRKKRKLVKKNVMRAKILDGPTVLVSLSNKDDVGRRFGVLIDSNGNTAYLFQDRTLILSKAPVSGFDAALIFLENNQIEISEKWRWHSVIGHDLFLMWAFAGMGLPEQVVYPDTSDALKMFRAWSFAIGGQHQLSRPDLPIVTGTDYQSGRVLQVVGCTIRLAPAYSYLETETDRLSKMIRNLTQDQSVFYGWTRSPNIERASGLYLHMTRIQDDIEGEIKGYPDRVFRDVVFPERILFSLRWIFQNALRFHAHYEEEAQDIVRNKVLKVIFSPDVAEKVENKWFCEGNRKLIRDVEFSRKQDVAEKIAEGIINEFYHEIINFYKETLCSFFSMHGVDPVTYKWLFEGLEKSKNAISEIRRQVHPASVWPTDEFVIDMTRGQVIRLKNQKLGAKNE